ncbi:MAG: Hemolysin-type calcium-binding repeat (2 copies) [Syntrophus sp. PtaU1.Bin208]|nr:MAG: Hemolysin-type calcium-binding repeat (2 copies) [Syntrophus sp. PtaU1.Bin208]
MATIKGTSGDDTITPGYVSPGVTGGIPSGAADTIYGYGGNDTIDGGGGNDWIDAGSGADPVSGGNRMDLRWRRQ